MTQPLNGQVAQPDNVLVRDLGGESVLLNLTSESYFGLDEIGTRMWAALSNSPSIEAAFDTLLAEYDVEAKQLRADLTAFLQELSVAGLIVIVDVPPGKAA